MLNAKSIRKVLCVILLVTFALSLVATSPVLAYLYRATFTVSNNGSTDYTALPVSCSADVDFLIDNGFITTSTALDTRVETLGGTDQIHMMVEDRIMAFCPSLESDSQLNWYLSTGNTALPDFPVIVGDDGYITVADNASLELGNNFSIELDGWVDTSYDNPTATYPFDPVVDATATSQDVSPGTSHVVALPGGIQSGNLLLMIFQTDYGAVGTVTWPPTGWISLAQYGQGSEIPLCIAYKVADGGEGASLAVSTSWSTTSAHQTLRISNYIGVPELTGTSSTTESANPNPPSISPSWGNSTVLWIAGWAGDDGAAIGVSSNPSGYGNRILSTDNWGSHYVGTCTARDTSAASTEDPGPYTLSGSIRWRAFTIAIRGVEPMSALVEKDHAFYIYPDSGTINACIYTSPIKIVTTTISSGGYVVEVWADTTDFGIDIDGVTQNTTALGGASAPNNAGDWTISLPYFNYYKHSVNGTLIAWYQPISYIVGTTLPDREGAAQNGTIVWGSNPAGVSVVLGSLTAPESTVTTEEEAGGYQGAMHEVVVTDWFLEPDIGTKLAAHPLRPLVTIWSDNSTVTEVQAWRFLGLALLLLITVVAAVMVRGHLLIAGLACGGTIALLVQQTVWPGWTLVFIIPAIIAGVMAERTPSIG